MGAIKEFTGDSEAVIEPLWERIAGRIAAEDVVHPETGEVLVARGDDQR